MISHGLTDYNYFNHVGAIRIRNVANQPRCFLRRLNYPGYLALSTSWNLWPFFKLATAMLVS